MCHYFKTVGLQEIPVSVTLFTKQLGSHSNKLILCLFCREEDPEDSVAHGHITSLVCFISYNNSDLFIYDFHGLLDQVVKVLDYQSLAPYSKRNKSC